ncbi:MAG: MBL fold metallo-hydrolase [Bacteroidales bacterium]|nr:MBL fold metallo-hydrolase [Bacteroidales bacterium]
MDRREFLNIGTGALVTAGLTGVIPVEAGNYRTVDAGDPLHYIDGVEDPGPLRMRFLGTGAADWNGKDERGELRRLSSVLLDDKVLIDFTPTDEDMLPDGVKPEVIFYTHSHGDHYNPVAALKLGLKRIHLGSSWIERAKAGFEKASKETGLPVPEIVPLSPGDKVTICGMTLTTLPANHATGDLKEQTLMYLIEKREVRVLYATDTGGIPAVAARLVGIDPHAKGKAITGLVMEATMGMDGDEDFRIFTHSSVKTVERTVHMLLREKRYTPPPGQPVYLTHLARTLHGTQAELDATLPSPLKAAHDGLEVTFTA